MRIFLYLFIFYTDDPYNILNFLQTVIPCRTGTGFTPMKTEPPLAVYNLQGCKSHVYKTPSLINDNACKKIFSTIPT